LDARRTIIFGCRRPLLPQNEPAARHCGGRRACSAGEKHPSSDFIAGVIIPHHGSISFQTGQGSSPPFSLRRGKTAITAAKDTAAKDTAAVTACCKTGNGLDVNPDKPGKARTLVNRGWNSAGVKADGLRGGLSHSRCARAGRHAKDTLMRISWMAPAMAAAMMLGSTLMAANFGGPAQATCGCDAAACGCNGGGNGAGMYGDPCDPGAGGCRGILCRNRGPRYEGMEAGFNCGCDGSYKYPVPPLYTYHWPGMWSAQLMTDYHSPWRFPPLKPYTDELVEPSMGAAPTAMRGVQQAAAIVETPAGAQRTSFSSHMEAMLR
jgi:hypothetical protein